MTVHENRFSKIESELAVLKWMVGFVIALLSAVALKLFYTAALAQPAPRSLTPASINYRSAY
jgi:hypothetical protein